MSENSAKQKTTAYIVKYDRPENNELVRVATIQKASQQQEVQTLNVQGVFYPPFAYQDLAGLYGINPYHDRCINVKAACTVGLGYIIEAVDPKDEKGKQKNEEYKRLKDFIENHSKYAGKPFPDTLLALSMDYEMTGDMYLEVVRNNVGEIAEVYHMPFKEMLIKYDTVTRIQTVIQWIPPSQTEFQPFGSKIQKPNGTGYVSEFIHIKNYNPNNRFYGMPEYLGALADISNDVSAATYQRAKFKNNCRPDVLIEVMDDFNKDTLQLITDFFRNNYKGEENAGKALVLFTSEREGGKDLTEKIKVTPFDSDLKEASFRQTRIDYRDAVIAAHGVPKTLLSIAQAGKLGNTESGDLKIFMELLIEPRQQRMEFMLNEMLIKQGLGITKFRIKLKELDIEDAKSAAEFLTAMSTIGAWKKNEIREYTGKEAIEGLDDEMPLLPAGAADQGGTPASVAQNAAAMSLNGIQIQAATKIVQAVSAGDIPRESAKNQLKIFFSLNDEQAEALLGDAGTGQVIQPDKKTGTQKATPEEEGADLVKSLVVLKSFLEKSVN
ncbi:MAG TPA: phage portal protein [Ignavibacteriales bacterium]|nr:phage portal protein [Ignavibacteriales bacterium]